MTDGALHVFTGLRWHVDTNVVDHPEVDDLIRLAELGWVRLFVGDQAHSEPMQNPAKYSELLPLLSKYDAMRGIAILDHSRFDMAVLASDEDVTRFDRVYTTLWPHRDREADGTGSTKRGPRFFRDAMHVDTAIRYGASGLITQDEAMWAADERFQTEFGGFRILSIRDAVVVATSAAQYDRYAASKHGKPDPATIPDWPRT